VFVAGFAGAARVAVDSLVDCAAVGVAVAGANVPVEPSVEE